MNSDTMHLAVFLSSLFSIVLLIITGHSTDSQMLIGILMGAGGVSGVVKGVDMVKNKDG